MVRFLRRDFRPREQIKDDKVHFDIDLFDDGTYSLTFDFEVDNIVFKKALEGMAKGQRLQFKMSQLEEEFEKMDFFVVDPRTYGMIARRLKGLIKQVEEQEKQDIRSFRIVTGKVNNITFERTGDMWIAKIFMEGEYVT